MSRATITVIILFSSLVSYSQQNAVQKNGFEDVRSVIGIGFSYGIETYKKASFNHSPKNDITLCSGFMNLFCEVTSFNDNFGIGFKGSFGGARYKYTNTVRATGLVFMNYYFINKEKHNMAIGVDYGRSLYDLNEWYYYREDKFNNFISGKSKMYGAHYNYRFFPKKWIGLQMNLDCLCNLSTIEFGGFEREKSKFYQFNLSSGLAVLF